MKRLFTLIVMVVVIVGASTLGAIAGVKTIKPDELKPANSTDTYVMFPNWVSSGSPTAGVQLIAKVKLPVGKTVKKVTYYHRGNAGAYTYVMLQRFKMGEDAEIISFADSHNTGNTHVTVETTFANFPKIKSGYTYFIEVWCDNSNSYFEGVKITYK